MTKTSYRSFVIPKCLLPNTPYMQHIQFMPYYVEFLGLIGPEYIPVAYYLLRKINVEDISFETRVQTGDYVRQERWHYRN